MSYFLSQLIPVAHATGYTLMTPLGTTTSVTGIADYIQKLVVFFGMGIGITALMTVLYGAILFTTSGGNMSRRQKGVDKMKKAAYGIFVFFGMTVILSTINPGLVNVIQPTWCGDGKVQTPNFSGQNEECDLNDYTGYTSATGASFSLGETPNCNDETSGMYPQGNIRCSDCYVDNSDCTEGDTTPTIPPGSCGDGNTVWMEGEECDPGDPMGGVPEDLGGEAADCSDRPGGGPLGYTPTSTLRCFDVGETKPSTGMIAQCTYDMSNCIPASPPLCGDGVVSFPPEECDPGDPMGGVPEDLGGEAADCSDRPGGPYDTATSTLRCYAPGEFDPSTGLVDGCTYNESGCVLAGDVCGDGVVQTSEDCEPAQGMTPEQFKIAGANCQTIPGGDKYSGGTLACQSAADPQPCRYDEGLCILKPTCNDGFYTPATEDCDYNSGMTGTYPCSAPFIGGTKTCSGCAWDTTQCTMCGNNIMDGTEVCDGTAMPGGITCGATPGPICGEPCTKTCNSTCTDIIATTCPPLSINCTGDVLNMDTDMCLAKDPTPIACNPGPCQDNATNNGVIGDTIDAVANTPEIASYVKALIAVNSNGSCNFNGSDGYHQGFVMMGYDTVGAAWPSCFNPAINTGLFQDDALYQTDHEVTSGCANTGNDHCWGTFARMTNTYITNDPPLARWKMRKMACMITTYVQDRIGSALCQNYIPNSIAYFFDPTACNPNVGTDTCATHTSCTGNTPMMSWECMYDNCPPGTCLNWTDSSGNTKSIKCDIDFRNTRTKMQKIEYCKGFVGGTW